MYFISLILILLGVIIGIALTSLVCIVALSNSKQIEKILKKGEKLVSKQQRGEIFEPDETNKVESILFGKQ